MRIFLAAAVLAWMVSTSTPARALEADSAQRWQAATDQAVAARDRGDVEAATALAGQALELARKELGDDSDQVAASLSLLGGLHVLAGDDDAAKPLLVEAVARREKRPGPDQQGLFTALSDLGNLYRRNQDYAQAEPLLQRSLQLREGARGREHLDYAAGQADLGILLRWTGRYPEAEAALGAALAMRERLAGRDAPETVATVEELGILYYRMGRYDQAVAQFERARAANTARHGAESAPVAGNLHNLASILDEQGKFAEADALFGQALAIREKVLGPDHIELASTLNNMAMRYYDQGRFPEAESAWQRALTIVEASVGREHPYVAALVTNIASLYQDMGKVEQSVPLYQRAVAIEEKVFGPEHPELAVTLNNLGLVRIELGQLAEAEPLFVRALAIQEKSLGADHPDVANTLQSLAGVYLESGRAAAALPLLDRALAIEAAALGKTHPDYASTLRIRAGVLAALGRHAEAEAGFQSAVGILRASLGPEAPDVVRALASQAGAEYRAGDYRSALGRMRESTRILGNRFVASAGSPGVSGQQQAAQRSAFVKHVEALEKALDQPSEVDARAREGFDVAQWAQATGVGSSVAQMAARFAAGDDALATLVRVRQDDLKALGQAEGELVAALGRPAEERDAQAEAALRSDADALRARLAASNRTLGDTFPQYQALVSPAPVPSADAQALLHDGEALVSYLVGEQRSFAWVVTPHAVSFVGLDIGARQLEQQVQFLRAKLRPDARGVLPAFAPATSSGLYEAVFAPLAPALRGARRVFVVADGALQNLPLGLLGADGEWLARRHAFAVLPSVAALRALRTFARNEPGTDPFAGFGDPVLEGPAGGQRGGVPATLFTTRSAGGLADVASLRKAPPLPDTADELRAIARALDAPATALFLREQATEAKVKNTDLSNTRFLAFATHAVTAGDLAGAAEPGLILTPPKSADAVDDGYLSASEVAQLELDADWVLLSACDTAAPDGAPGAEGLSGLAKAFFYAGSRALLVSHWPVASGSTRDLVTDTVRRYVAAPADGKPEALQAAMLAMMARPDTAHPFYWAPFSVVGD